MPPKYRRYSIRTKEAKAILEIASEKTKVDLEKILGAKTRLESVGTGFGEILLVNNRPLLVKMRDNVFPTLFFREIFASAPKVVVDMGAVPHVCSGADVMAPGIVRFEGEFGRGDLVYVVDEKHGKPIAIGEAMHDYDTASMMSKGVVVKNLHYVGDKIWGVVKGLADKVGEGRI